MKSFLEIPYQEHTLRGMLHAPDEGATNCPVVVMFHGYTGNRIEAHRVFFHFGNVLAQRGIASVRMDFLGCGESDGDYAEMTLASLLDQAKQIVNWVHKNRPGSEIRLIGYSLGGLVGSLVLEDVPDIQRAVLISPGRPERILDRDRGLYEQAESAVLDINGNPVGKGYYLQLPQFVDRPRCFHEHQDILIVHGTEDMATPIEHSQRYLTTPGGQKRLIAVDGADHGYSSLPWQRELMHHVIGFLSDAP